VRSNSCRLRRKSKCSFTKAVWEPGFGSQQTVQRGGSLAAEATITEDDTVRLSAMLACDVAKPEYVSATFVGASGASAAVLLQADSGKAGQLTGRVKATDLAAQVRRTSAHVPCRRHL
jgi:hypothetical protein